MESQSVEPYDEVHALLLGWEHDTQAGSDNYGNGAMRTALQSLKEVLSVSLLYSTYSEWMIPDKEEPGHDVYLRIHRFREDYNKARALMIIYYGGHGSVDAKHQLLWTL
jgi:hypothetical protein